ncbi:MAG: hypothetical protein JSR58_06235 [Verrucomicrobia bacterium]|nr:hypothetical protein [Verrucomicrobiota bacterium]
MQVHIDRLRQGQAEKIALEASSDFIDIKEEDLSFSTPVSLVGEALIIDEELIIQLHVKTKAKIPCSICNKPIDLSIDIPDFVHTISLAELKGPHYNYSEAVREEILLQIPAFAECEGSCPERAKIAPYLKKPSAEVFPFSNL